MDVNICRLCFENIGVISLFDYVDSGIQLRTKVSYCAKVAVIEGDGLPAHICMNCEEILKTTYSFILKCEETDRKLRDLQFNIKQEYDSDAKCNLIDCDYKLPSDNNLEVPSNSPLSNTDTLEEKHLIVRTKRKYLKRSIKAVKRAKCEPINCKICGRICKNRSTLVTHMRSHTNEKPYTCSSCDKRYKDIGTLKRHVERNHNDGRTKTFICEHCGKGFYSKSDCKIHKRTHTGETPFACTRCPARFTQIGSLQRHTLTHTGERSHMCSLCPKKFPTKSQLREHYKVHSSEKKFKCSFCDMLFKYYNNMRKHLKYHTDGMIKKFTCDECGNTFRAKGNLQIHIKNQHSKKSGYCTECSKHVPNLEMHMWRHAGLRPIKCELCPSSFFDMKGLSTHVSFRHKSVDKFKCTINDCTVTFPTQAMLDYHVMRYHRAIKPFSCNECPRRFYRKSDMARHKKASHKDLLMDLTVPKTLCTTESQSTFTM